MTAILPPLPVALAFLSLPLLPLMQVILARAFPRATPGSILRFALPGALLIYVGALWFTGWSNERPEDLCAGFLVFAAIGIVWYLAFSLLAYGFTLAMLTTIARAIRPLTLETWMSAYSGGGAANSVAQNRLRVLVISGTATVADGYVTLTPRGRLVARLAGFLRTVLGLE